MQVAGSLDGAFRIVLMRGQALLSDTRWLRADCLPSLTAQLLKPAPLLLQSSGLEFKSVEIEADYALNVLWLDKSIGLAVDQIFKGVRCAAALLRLSASSRPFGLKASDREGSVVSLLDLQAHIIIMTMMILESVDVHADCAVPSPIRNSCPAAEAEEPHHRVLLLA